MQASFASAAQLRQLVDAVSATVQEASLEFAPEGLGFRAMDPAHVCLVRLDLPASVFSAYACPAPVAICLSLVHLGKILKTAAPADALTLSCDRDPDVLRVLIQGADREAEYELRLMNVDGERLEIPELVSDAVFEVPSKALQSLVANLALLDADTVELEVEGEGRVAMRASGGVAAGLERLPLSSAERAPAGLRVSYQLGYLQQFARAAGIAPVARVEMSAEAPLVLSYGFLSFYLAPKLAAE